MMASEQAPTANSQNAETPVGKISESGLSAGAPGLRRPELAEQVQAASSRGKHQNKIGPSKRADP
jgi:hypothetical protein